MNRTSDRAALLAPELMVLAAAAIWGATGVFVRMASLPSTHMSFFRMAVPTVVIGGWFLVRRHRIPRDGMGLRLLASVINAVRMYFFFLAFSFTSVATATVTLYSWPLFAVLFSRLLLGERVSRRRWALLLLGFAGVPLLYFGGEPDVVSAGRTLAGIASMLVSAAFHALAVTLLKRARAGGSHFETTFFQNLVGSVVFGVVVLFSSYTPEVVQIAWGLGLGVATGLVGFTLFFVALHRLPTGTASNLAYFEVVVAAAFGTVLLGEPLTWGTIAGAALIGCSLVFSRTAR